MKVNTPFKAYFGHKLDVSNLRVFGSTAWAQIPLDKRRALQLQSIECLFIGYLDESKGFKQLDIKTKQIIIKRSVKFDEPLQEVELVKEKIAEFPSYSTKYLDDEIGGDDPDLDPLIYDISMHQSSEPEVQNHLPTWAQQTLSSTGENIGNPNDPRRTQSDFQRAGIVLSCSDNFLSKTCYLMIISDPKSYYHARMIRYGKFPWMKR